MAAKTGTRIGSGEMIAEDAALRQALASDFQALDNVSIGLADRAVDYVLTGKDAAALVEIADAQRQTGGYGSRLGLLQNRQHPAAIVGEHKLFLKDHGPHGLPELHRFGQVLAAAQPAWRIGLGSSAIQRDDVLWLAHLLHDHNEPLKHDAQAKAADKNRHLRQAETLVSLMQAAKADLVGLIEMLHSQSERYGSGYGLSGIRRNLEGLDSVLTRHADVALSSFLKLQPHGRVAFIEDLSRLGIATRPPFLEFVWSQACSPSKTMSKVARAALAPLPADSLIGLAETTFASGDATARRCAAEALAQLAGPAAKPALVAQAKAEKSKASRDAITALVSQIVSLQKTGGGVAVREKDVAGVARHATVMRAIDGNDIVIPPMPPLPDDTPLPANALEPLRVAIPAYNAAVRDENARVAAHHQAQGWTWRPTRLVEIDPDTAISEFHSFLNGTGATKHDFAILSYGLPWVPSGATAAYKGLISRSDATLWHLLRLANLGKGNRNSVCGILWSYRRGADEEEIAARCRQLEDIRVPIAIAERLGVPRGQAVREMLTEWGSAYRRDEAPSLVFHVYEHLDLLEEALGLRPRSGDRELVADRAVKLLGELPKVPEQFLKPLLDLAVGSRKSLHKSARALLRNAVGIEAAILVRLADPKKEVRAAAATWMGERGQASAVPALEKALKKEKSEEGRAEMLTALSRLGVDISEHLSEKMLKSEAVKGLEKTPAKSLDWFPFDTVPALKWGTGKKVDPTIVRWWIVLADKLKSPSGNALFDFYLHRLRLEDAERLGLFMLSTFIARDTISPSEADARAHAKAYADEQQRIWQQWSGRHPHLAAQHPFNYQQYFEYGRLAKLSQHLHSAAEHRGILGLASRALGADAAALVRRYLKENGSKVSQAKSLLAALSANPAPAAIQAVLAAANRLKQKSVQTHAAELVQAIAERRGWTPDELADRTIPTAGFDEAGELELPCGAGRTFKAVNHGEGRIELINPAGKTAKALPDPRGDDAAEKEEVAASKRALSGARKEVKQVEKMQAERLYEAMCVERAWAIEVWRDHLKDHPIVGRLCRRMVWLGLDAEGQTIATFRALDDGTLTGKEDEAVEIGKLAAVKVAHQALISESDAMAWQAHLRDYEVRPLFQQFGRTVLKAGSDMAEATEIDDRKGWMIDNFKMASAAGKLGYERGSAEDGGHVSTYSKRFTGAQISAVMQFTGHYIADSKQVPCALISATFVPISDGRGFRRPLALGKVAPVLLSEVWSDLHAIAASGSGFDKDWEKKASY